MKGIVEVVSIDEEDVSMGISVGDKGTVLDHHFSAEDIVYIQFTHGKHFLFECQLREVNQ